MAHAQPLARSPRFDAQEGAPATAANEAEPTHTMTDEIVRRIAFAMLRDASRLIVGGDARDVIEVVSWVWGEERELSLSLKNCCLVLGIDDDDIRGKYWLMLSHARPDLLGLTKATSADELQEIVQRAAARQMEEVGQLDLFSSYAETTRPGNPGRIH